MAKHAAPRTQYRWWIPAAVVTSAAALVLMILVIDRGEDEGTPPTADSAGPAPEAVVTEVADPEQSDLDKDDSADESDPMSDGPVDAPVKLVVFSDYQCPYCAAWSKDTLPTMLDYVDSGDLRIEWREVNVFGSASEQAAKAAYAAALQNKHWKFHDALFADGKPRSPDELTSEALTEKPFLEMPGFLIAGQWATLAFEFLSPLALLAKGKWLYGVVAFFCLFHLMTYLALGIHFLPTVICWAAFLPLRSLCRSASQRLEHSRDRTPADSVRAHHRHHPPGRRDSLQGDEPQPGVRGSGEPGQQRDVLAGGDDGLDEPVVADALSDIQRPPGDVLDRGEDRVERVAARNPDPLRIDEILRPHLVAPGQRMAIGDGDIDGLPDQGFDGQPVGADGVL
jgi:hypothetical protein